jgi:predicted amidophosphoribosyltransferase
MADKCAECGEWNEDPKDRFCRKCTKLIRSEMSESGYLQKVPVMRSYRSQDQKELTRETKYGIDR